MAIHWDLDKKGEFKTNLKYMAELNALEIIVIKHAKEKVCLSISNNFGLSLDDFTSACKSLQKKGLVDGIPIPVDQGYIISFNLKKDALRLI